MLGEVVGEHVRVGDPVDPSNAPRGENWGEVVRVYPPGSWQFKYLYGVRNDTEARHADLKARVKHLPADVPGQLLRLLAASMTINAAGYQVHLQANGMQTPTSSTTRPSDPVATTARLGPPALRRAAAYPQPT